MHLLLKLKTKGMLNLNFCHIAPAIIHNLSVDKISLLPNFPDYSLETSYNLGWELLNNIINPGTTQFSGIPYSSVQGYLSEIENGMISEDLIIMMDNAGLLSSYMLSILQQLNGTIKNRENLDGFDDDLNSFIENIISDTNLTYLEKLVFISAGNVSIAGKNYWLNASNDPNNPWYPALQDEMTNDPLPNTIKMPKWLKVVCIVGIDAVGVVLGGLLGSAFDPPITGQGATVIGGGASAASTKAFFG